MNQTIKEFAKADIEVKAARDRKKTLAYRLFRKSPLYEPVKQCYINYRNWKFRERKHIKKDGWKNEKPIYIIRQPRGFGGFFINFFAVLKHCTYAESKGWTPVVDMEGFPTIYNESKPVNGTMNSWEYYFDQPGGIGLEKAYSAHTQIYSVQNCMPNGGIELPSYVNSRPIQREGIERIVPYMDKFIHIKSDILDEVAAIIAQWPENVLGVHMRGTDMYTWTNHPCPPELEQFEEKISAFLTKYGSGGGRVLLCTDEERMLSYMKQKFGDAIICTNAYRSTDGTAVHTDYRSEPRENHHYLLGKEVLQDALLLASCSDLICGHSNVAYAAILFNRAKYRSVTILENQTKKFNE